MSLATKSMVKKWSGAKGMSAKAGVYQQKQSGSMQLEVEKSPCIQEVTIWMLWRYKGNSSKTHPVCHKKVNAYGLCDMTGNVWEWVWDRYGAYSASKKIDPMGPTTGGDRFGEVVALTKMQSLFMCRFDIFTDRIPYFTILVFRLCRSEL